MDRSALPVRACLTRRNGCAAPPSTMQKISCDMRSVMRGGSADKKGVLHLRRLVGCLSVRRRRCFRGNHGVRRLHEVRSRVQWQLPGVDASQALRGKRVSWNTVSSHDMDMGRRGCVKRRLHREAGHVCMAVNGCSSRSVHV